MAALATFPQVKVTDSPMTGFSLLISILKHCGPTGGVGEEPGGGGLEAGGFDAGGVGEAVLV